MVVCVVGPIAAGKNYVCSLLEARGFFCVDADRVIHKIIKEKEEEIFEAFKDPADARGIDLRAADGSLDRRALGRLLFCRPDLLERQERILYPEFEARTQKLIDQENARSGGEQAQGIAADCGQPESSGKPKTACENCAQAQDATQKAKDFADQNADGSAQPVSVCQAAADFSANQKAWVDQNAGGGNYGFGIRRGSSNVRGLVINATLLYKTPKILRQCQKIIYVDAPLFVRLLRARRRDKLPLTQILRRIKSQKGLLQEYKRFAAENGIEFIKVDNWKSGGIDEAGICL